MGELFDTGCCRGQKYKWVQTGINTFVRGLSGAIMILQMLPPAQEVPELLTAGRIPVFPLLPIAFL